MWLARAWTIKESRALDKDLADEKICWMRIDKVSWADIAIELGRTRASLKARRNEERVHGKKEAEREIEALKAQIRALQDANMSLGAIGRALGMTSKTAYNLLIPSGYKKGVPAE